MLGAQTPGESCVACVGHLILVRRAASYMYWGKAEVVQSQVASGKSVGRALGFFIASLWGAGGAFCGGGARKRKKAQGAADTVGARERGRNLRAHRTELLLRDLVPLWG